jgi:hypothetical protein
MRKPLGLRSSFESVFSGIGACRGDPFDIGSPAMSQRQLNHGLLQNRIGKACVLRPGINKAVTAAARCGGERSVASLTAAGTCYSEKLMSVRIYDDR